MSLNRVLDPGQPLRWRHDLHRIPETAFTEQTTSDYVAGVLATWGIEVQRGLGGTGLVGSLQRGNSSRTIALRADMDALPLEERTGLPYTSQHPGRMHACGHDGHMAMLLGAAARLSGEGDFDGTVRFLFQPAEEPGRGAQAMLDDGLLQRLPFDEVYGLHNIPGIPAGHLHTRAGAVMASEDNFTITVTGVGGHASRPHLVVDPLVTGAQIVTALQGIVSRSTDPLQAVVVSCTEFVTDGARNAIPGTVVIRGDVRTFDDGARTTVEHRMRQICSGVAAAAGASIDVVYTHEFEPTVNSALCATAAVAAATAVVGDERVDADCPPITASEDFGVLARAVPGCFTFIGNGVEGGPGGVTLHSRDYDFNDAILPIGIDFYVRLVRDRLPTTDTA